MIRPSNRLTLPAIAVAVACILSTANANQEADWGDRFGDASFDDISAIAHDAAGNVYVAGSFRATINLGGSTFTAAGDNDIFVAKFTASGQHLWSRAGGGLDSETVIDIAVAAGGTVAVVGTTLSSTLTFEGSQTTTNGGADAFAVLYSSNGTYNWTQAWGGSGSDLGGSLAFGSDNSLRIAGTFRGTVDFGPGPPVTAVGLSDFFILHVTVFGSTFVAHTYGGPGLELGGAVALDANDDLLFTGAFEQEIDLGSGLLTSAGSRDICVAKFLGSAERATWSQSFGGPATDSGSHVISGNAESVCVVGAFQGTVDFGGGSNTSQGGSDLFVACFESDGTYVWSRTGGGPGNDFAAHVDLADGRIAVAGAFQQTADFEEFELTAGGEFDALLLVQDEQTGDIECAVSGGGAGLDLANQCVITDGIYVVGGFEGIALFGQVQLHSAGLSDAFLVHYVDRVVAVADVPASPVSALIVGAARPNPFRAQTTIELSPGAGRRAEARVYDASGRLVRRLGVDAASSTGAVSWDGRHASGTRVPAGVYYVEVRRGSERRTERVTLLR